MKYIFGGKNYYIVIFPPICQGENGYNHFSGEEIYYITIFPPIQIRGKMAKKWLWGKNGSITPASLRVLFRSLTSL